MAAYGATIGASFAIGPAVGGALTTWLGWRAVFLINIPLGLTTLLATLAWVRESRDSRARKLDWPGQLTLSAGLFLLVLAPMLPLALFRRRGFTAAQVTAFAISASFFALYLYITLYLQNLLHLSALDAGLVYPPRHVPGVRRLRRQRKAERARRPSGAHRRRAPSGRLGLALITIIGPRSSWTAILPATLVVSVGTGQFNPALASLALGDGSTDQCGLLAAVNDAFRRTGVAVCVAVFGALGPASAALGHGAAKAYVAGLYNALLLGAAVAAAGAVVTLALIGIRHQQPTSSLTANEVAEIA